MEWHGAYRPLASPLHTGFERFKEPIAETTVLKGGVVTMQTIHPYIQILLKVFLKTISESADKAPHVPLNYRGITVTSCLSKVYSGVLKKKKNN